MTTQNPPPRKCYRCGWCGQPCDQYGHVLSCAEANAMDVDWDFADQVDGDCCGVSLRDEQAFWSMISPDADQ